MGTTPGLNFLYVHLNRLIKENDVNMIYVIGPGLGGPGLVAHTYLEGSYIERYPAIERSRNGLHRLFCDPMVVHQCLAGTPDTMLGRQRVGYDADT